MTALEADKHDIEREKKAREALEYARNAENEAVRKLAEAVKTTATIKRRYEEIFEETQRRMCERRKSGLIEVCAGY
jgi:hypothetical protein